MRKYLPLTFLFLLLLSFKAKSQETFRIQFPDNKDFFFSEFNKSPVTNDYYFSFIDRSNTKAIGVAKYNNGVKWAKLFTLPNIDSSDIERLGPTLCPSNDGGIIFGFTLKEYASPFYKFVVCAIKCDSLGNIIWKKILDRRKETIRFLSSPQICEAKDGSVYFVFHNFYTYYDIIKLNKNADFVCSKRLEMYSVSYNDIDAVTATSDNGLLVAEAMSGYDGFSKSTTLQRFDTEGNFLWLAAPYSEEISSSKIMLMKCEGKEIHTIFRVYSNTYRSKIMVLNFNEERTNIAANLITDNYFSLKYYLKHKKADYAKGMPLSGFSTDQWLINSDWSLTHSFYDYSNDDNGIRSLEKYDAANRLCPYYVPVVFARGDSSYSIQLSNGSKKELPAPLLKMGALNITSSSYKINYDVECSGSATSHPAVSAIQTKSSVNIAIFPNPASQTLKITGLKSDTNITLRNSSGSILNKYVINTTAYNININALSAGLYTLTINDGKNITVKKFIKN